MFVESDDETIPEEISLKRTSPTSLTIPNAKKQKSTTSTTSCDKSNKSAIVMSKIKGRGRGQQKQNTTVRGRGGRGARYAIGGWDEDKATTIAERLMLMTVMMAIMDRWFLWMWRMPISKHGCPLLLCTINLSNAVKQTTVNIGGHQMKWMHHTTCCFECGPTGGDGMQKIVGIIDNFFLSNAYFCIHHMSCHEQARQNVQKKNIYMGNYYFQDLTQEHVKLLQHYGYWEHILKSCQNLIYNTNSKQTG